MNANQIRAIIAKSESRNILHELHISDLGHGTISIRRAMTPDAGNTESMMLMDFFASMVLPRYGISTRQVKARIVTIDGARYAEVFFRA